MINFDKLKGEIEDYCVLNNISDVDGFINKCLLNGFNIERYGLSPSDNVKKQNGVVEEDKKPDTKDETKIVRKKRKISIKSVD